jgi:hypothetical protein
MKDTLKARDALLLPLFFLLFRHWSFKTYVAKRASIICLLCYHNMSHVLPFFALSDEDDLKVQAQAWANMRRE